ncbi:uncharacterized protein LOC113157776 [Anabas testudineus]|uniref:uncharacterized protein LOC113157776 n=1 Tax=Anabas testudineus TaxID=64144 RepID=UPI000E460E4E|nr:uncharacterized protein LOC113157776 [Anabas testudineus]
MTNKDQQSSSLPQFPVLSTGVAPGVVFCCYPITNEPEVTVNSTWDDSNKSCTVLLECSSTSNRSVTYSWSVKNQTQSGTRLKVNIRPEDGETTVTCTISDHVSEKSASKPVNCSNITDSVPPDVEASTCPSSSSIIHKKVGDTVKLSSCLPTEGVTLATWKHRDTEVADKDLGVTTAFKDRFDLNRTDFSLTVNRLTLQDSGNFSFISDVNDKQRPTVVITLQVHEPITKEPDVTVNSTWDDSNKSCTVLVECRSTSDSVTYSWSVKNKTQSGSRLKVDIRPEDGETTVTCTISDHVSKKSASKPVKCSNNTDSVLPPGTCR